MHFYYAKVMQCCAIRSEVSMTRTRCSIDTYSSSQKVRKTAGYIKMLRFCELGASPHTGRANFWSSQNRRHLIFGPHHTQGGRKTLDSDGFANSKSSQVEVIALLPHFTLKQKIKTLY